MFYPVRVKDQNGKVKNLLKSKDLSDIYWNKFFELEAENNFIKNGENQVPPKILKQLKKFYPELYDYSAS